MIISYFLAPSISFGKEGKSNNFPEADKKQIMAFGFETAFIRVGRTRILFFLLLWRGFQSRAWVELKKNPTTLVLGLNLKSFRFMVVGVKKGEFISLSDRKNSDLIKLRSCWSINSPSRNKKKRPFSNITKFNESKRILFRPLLVSSSLFTVINYEIKFHGYFLHSRQPSFATTKKSEK